MYLFQRGRCKLNQYLNFENSQLEMFCVSVSSPPPPRHQKEGILFVSSPLVQFPQHQVLTIYFGNNFFGNVTVTLSILCFYSINSASVSLAKCTPSKAWKRVVLWLVSQKKRVFCNHDAQTHRLVQYNTIFYLCNYACSVSPLMRLKLLMCGMFF